MLNYSKQQTVLWTFALVGVALFAGCQASSDENESSAPNPTDVSQTSDEPPASGDSNVPPSSDEPLDSDDSDDSPSSDEPPASDDSDDPPSSDEPPASDDSDDPPSSDEPPASDDSDDPPSSDDADAPPSSDDTSGTDLPVTQASCPLTPKTFAGWFQKKDNEKVSKVTKNGFVTPANSLQSLDSLCAFYEWSWRMFLWQVSETPNGLVFNTPPFFDLNESNELVSNKAGVSSRKFLRGGKLEQTDRTGQAGVVSGVLMAQPVDVEVNRDGSLVYYAIHVNDVYAYMASGVNSNGLDDVTQFPTTESERRAIVTYAKSVYGVDIDDSDTLAMEMKSSWVKADESIDLKEYFITIKSDVPLYVKQSDTTWTWDGTAVEKDVTLALVGYHLVGSTLGHPEMIWATFEHSQNVPDTNYYYVDSNGDVSLKKNWNDDGTPILKNWRFRDQTSKEQSSNQMLMELQGTTIKATPGNNNIGPGNTMRTHPWGGKPDESSAVNNTAIISLNQKINSMLADGDVRKNYFFVGATWTDNGVPNVGFQIPEVAGSLTLANATMETYFQFKNCFGCHNGGKLSGLSHIFGGIKPLKK